MHLGPTRGFETSRHGVCIYKLLGRRSFHKTSSNPIASLQTRRKLVVVVLQVLAAQSKERRLRGGIQHKSFALKVPTL